MEQTARPLLATAALGALLLLTAGLLDVEPLYVPAVALLALAVGAGVWVFAGARGLTVQRTLGARRAMEGEPIPVVVGVRARRLLPSGVVVDPLLPQPAPLPIGRRSSEVRFDVRFGRRGRKVLASPRVVVRDPLGLLGVVAAGTAPEEEVLVLPRVEPVHTEAGRARTDDGVLRRVRRPALAAEVEIDGLREHRLGTPASRIFWPALARSGDLLERRLAADGDARPLVVLDPRGAVADEDVDAAVRAAASLAVHLGRHGGCAVLVPGDRRPVALEPALTGWPHLHARLALVEAGASPALGALTARRGAIVYVAAQRLRRPPRALAHAPGGGRVLVVPQAMPGRRSAFTVAGCFGYEVSARGRRAGAAA